MGKKISALVWNSVADVITQYKMILTWFQPQLAAIMLITGCCGPVGADWPTQTHTCKQPDEPQDTVSTRCADYFSLLLSIKMMKWRFQTHPLLFTAAIHIEVFAQPFTMGEWKGTMIPSAAMWNEFAVKVRFISTEAHCWFVSRHTHLEERRRTILLFHSSDATVIQRLGEISKWCANWAWRWKREGLQICIGAGFWIWDCFLCSSVCSNATYDQSNSPFVSVFSLCATVTRNRQIILFEWLFQTSRKASTTIGNLL